MQQLSLDFIDAPFAIVLDFFEGPMDLLLHLVKKQEVSIDDVKMSVIAEQYLEIVSRDIDNIDLDRAAEFLVIAATLLDIKSKSLLPSEINLDEIPDYEDGSGFFESLREKIRQYELTKQRADALILHPQLGINVFTRRDRDFFTPDVETMGENESPNMLGSVFASLLKRIGSDIRSFRVKLEPVSVVSCMMKIIDTLKVKISNLEDNLPRGASFSFSKVVSGLLGKDAIDLGDLTKSKQSARSLVIGSFMAVLELAKRGLLSASQSVDNGEISIALKMDSDSSYDMSLIDESSVEESYGVSNDDEFIEEDIKEEVNRG